MEKTPHSSETSNDDSTKKEKSSDKSSRVSHIPLPIEAQRREAENVEHHEAEKKHKSKKKKSKHSKQADSADDGDKKPEVQSDTAQPAEKAAEAEKQPLKLPAPEYDGVLLISDRLRRQREEAERTSKNETSEDEGEEADDEEAEDNPVAVAEETHEKPSEKPDTAPANAAVIAEHKKAESLTEPESTELLSEEGMELEPEDDIEREPDVPETPEVSRPTPVSESLPELNRAAPKPETGNKYPTPPAPPTPPSWRAFPSPPFSTGGFDRAPAAADAAPQPPAARPEINRVEAIRRPDTRSLLAGILVGGLIEHVRHKRREKRMTKQHTQEIKGLTSEQEKMRYGMIETNRRKTALEQQIERLRIQIDKTKEAIAAPATAAAAANLEASRVTKPLSPEQSPLTRARAEQQPTPADSRFASPEVVAARKKLQEALAQEKEEFDAGARPLAPNRRLETSAWHHIEIDKETGKPVENPSVAYGEEFQHEQHQERLRREIEAASIAGEDTRKQQLSGSPGGGLPSGTAGVPGQPPSATSDRSARGPSNPAPIVSSAADLVLWGILTVVVIAIIVALTA